MIVTDLAHAKEQIPQTPRFMLALNFLERTDLATLAEGTIEIDGKRVFASVQWYTTFAAGAPFKFEAHQKYIDIQYMVEGEEMIGWVPSDQITFDTPYDTTGDIQFGTAPTNQAINIKLKRNDLTVLFPSDGHAPRHTVTQSMPVKKIVVKVAV
jgi:YhcH/YjgK/YiaL family protein